MADEHRRVEPRGIVGSGMLTDAERIEQLEQERARLERTWRDAPKRRFGEVLSEVPPRGPEEEGEDTAARRARVRAGDEPDDRLGSEDDGAAASPAAISEEPEDEPPLPRVPPDPRMARLHAMLDHGGRSRRRGRERP